MIDSEELYYALTDEQAEVVIKRISTGENQHRIMSELRRIRRA